MIVQQIAGGAVKWEQLPVYLIPELLAGAVAGIAYTLITPDPEDTAAPSTDAPGIPRRPPKPPPPSDPAPAQTWGATMKKLINDPATVVTDALRGMAAAHPELRVDLDNKIVYRGDAPVHGKVGIISGGGSGHEPLHGGFVGVGMLDAACAGEVFTSPVPDQMLAATKAVDGGAGVLHIV
ncbi:MAG: dihydroxyacetone kinase subunit DhaK, partial [Kineosporiaceae bacterium]